MVMLSPAFRFERRPPTGIVRGDHQSDLSGLDYSQLHEDSESTVRLNNAGTEAGIAYDGARPSTLSGITALTKDSRTEHTHAEILILMADASWIEEEE